MSEDSEPQGTLRRFARWATTPPQAYGVYLAAVVLVWVLSFYAGSLKPKPAPQAGPPPVTAPRN